MFEQDLVVQRTVASSKNCHFRRAFLHVSEMIILCMIVLQNNIMCEMSPEDVLKIVDPSHNSSPLKSQNMSRRNL